MLHPSRILVIHTAFLGDLVIASAFLRTLRKRYPEAAILFVTTPDGASLLANNPWQIEVRVFDKRGKDAGWQASGRILREIRAWRPDWAISLHRYLRSTLLALGSGARLTFGFADAPLARFHSHTVERSSFIYESERYHALLPDPADRQDLIPELFFSEADREHGQHLLHSFADQPFLAIAPSSAWATKRWPADRFGAIARWAWESHRIRSVILCGKSNEERTLAGIVERAFVHTPGKDKCFDGLPLNLAGQTGLGSLKYILSRARVVLANDSAPLHLGIAMGAPVVGIFGPTTRELGFFPLGKGGRTRVAEVPLYCRPCGKHGHDSCPEVHFRCMKELTVDTVQEKLEPFLC